MYIFKGIQYLFSLPSLIYKKINLFLKSGNVVIKESFIALLICAIGDLFAGIILGNMTFFLKTYPGLMVIIPGAIGMRGNIFGSFGSRLSTHLHIGTLSPKFEMSDILVENISSSLILTMILSVLLAVVGYIVCLVFNFQCISIFDLVLILFIAGLISTIIMLPITMFISLKSYENGWDPDNITTPLIAACGDFLTLPSIIISVILISLFTNLLVLKIALFLVVIAIVIISFVYGYYHESGIKRIVRQSTPVLFACSILGALAGGVLNNSLSTLLKNQTLLTLIPLFSGESGGLVSILGARLSSALHSGLIEPNLKPGEHTVENFTIIIILAIIMYPIIAIMAETSTIAFGGMGIGYPNIILISFISGLILVLFMIFIVYYISAFSYGKGLDPDNIVIPLSTSLTDSISTLILIMVSLIILGLTVL
ncbi:MAG: magnesium transporter [Methanobacteriaceae archaeon]|nr:magnesium transporter [Methanobacteriaceae archaeon]